MITDETERLVISTLGPAGTCSEYASLAYLKSNNLVGDVELYPTFEESATALKNGESDRVIIPSAYASLGEIFFGFKDHIELTDVFRLQTPNLVIANRGDNRKVRTISTHSSPRSLAQGFYPDAQLVLTRSNSESANMLLAQEVDACLTTSVCARYNSLHVVHDFGGIPMAWNVFKRRRDAAA